MKAPSKKIAICIHGLFRNWDICRSSFFDLESQFPYFQFDYYIAVWDNSIFTDGRHLDSTEPNSWVVDITKDDFVEDFTNRKLVNYRIVNNTAIPYDDKSPIGKMAYLEQVCNNLKSDHENDNNFQYDYVLNSRCDILFGRNFINCIREYIDENSIERLGIRGSCGDHLILGSPLMVSDEHAGGHFVDDTFAFGTSPTIDIYSSMYLRYFQNHDPSNMPMVTQHGINSHLILSNSIGVYGNVPEYIICRDPLRLLKDLIVELDYRDEEWHYIKGISNEWDISCQAPKPP